MNDSALAPTDREIRIARLRELVKVITDRTCDMRSEFTMRIPAQPNRDADLVLSWAADELENVTAELDRVKAQRDRAATLLNKVADQRYKGGRSVLWHSGPIDMDAIRALLSELEG